MLGIQRKVIFACVSFIHEDDETFVFFVTDYTSRGLQNLLPSRELICVGESVVKLILEILRQDLTFLRYLRKSDAYDKSAFQSISGQVDAFSEMTAQNRESQKCLSSMRFFSSSPIPGRCIMISMSGIFTEAFMSRS